jgi:hypothetical protein
MPHCRAAGYRDDDEPGPGGTNDGQRNEVRSTGRRRSDAGATCIVRQIRIPPFDLAQMQG